MDSNEAKRTPHPIAGVDLRSLPIGPVEAFVLSRVDGKASETDIAASTGLDQGQVHDCLKRLTELGAVRFNVDDHVARAQTERPPPSTDSKRLSHPVIEALGDPHGRSADKPPAALYDPSELDEHVDLDLTKKRKILDLFYRLDSLDHYALLGVQPSADKKAIKGAYYEVVNLAHPDKYFGKNLGSFKPKMERIFQRLTEAHDVLTRNRTREEYDAYLATQQKNVQLDRIISDELAQAKELEQVRRRIEEEARLAERVEHVPPSSVVAPMSSRPPDPESRRKALARKLGRSIAPGRPSQPPSAPPPTKDEMRLRIADDLKRRYDQRVATVKQKQVDHYRAAADEALSRNDVVAASNALRLAASLAPDDTALQAEAERTQVLAQTELADSFISQARYEEQAGRHSEAARSYQRAALGKPSAQVFERAAHCLLEADGDLRHAGDLCKQGIAMDPENTQIRLTLARVYLAAGMPQSAQLELERAAALRPDDDSIANWLNRVKRGEG